LNKVWNPHSHFDSK